MAISMWMYEDSEITYPPVWSRGSLRSKGGGNTRSPDFHIGFSVQNSPELTSLFAISSFFGRSFREVFVVDLFNLFFEQVSVNFPDEFLDIRPYVWAHFGQAFGQISDQIFGQVVDQVLGEGNHHKYRV